MRYETVIGLEIHVQLATRTKMFCGDEYDYGAEPNTRVCPVCLGLPGALPTVNGVAVELGVRAALGLGCTVHGTSAFARKNYFYPDMPKGYQITQYDRPLGTDGMVGVDTGGEPGGVRIRRVHLEEDSGKSDHERFDGLTALDFNRAGVPLLEIVTEPDIRSPAHARAFLVRLKRLLEYLDVSDCDMEKGSLRADANVSLRPVGSGSMGTKTEVKNLNSFASVERALSYEGARQTALLEAGEGIVHETRLWDVGAGEARVMRSKEESHDYRYFPEPDLPPLVVADELVDRMRRGLPEPPDVRAGRFHDDYGISPADADALTAARELADYFESVVREGSGAGAAGAAANWILTDVLAWLNERGEEITAFPVSPAGLADLIALVGDGTLSSTMGSSVLRRMARTGRPASRIVEEEGLAQVSDEDSLRQWVTEALDTHPEQAGRLRAGEEKLVGFFMGEIMQRSAGKADPKRCAAMLRDLGRAGGER